MHPQTLRIYEARGLIKPKRSPKGTRLYSQEDVERLRRIQELTTELGMNLAGVERVLELEEQLEADAQARSPRSSSAPSEAQAEMAGRARAGAHVVPRRARPDQARRGADPAGPEKTSTAADLARI